MKNREEKLKEYYENPSYCQYCGELIKVRDNQNIYDAKRKKFCNRSCSASFNNKGKARNPEGSNGKEIVERTKICPSCGGKKIREQKYVEIVIKQR